MLTPERHRLILELLKEKEVVKIIDLVEITSTSESTIRRDLSQLEEQQLLKRVHGGASLPKRTRDEQGVIEKSTKNLQEKKSIAQFAANFVNSGECIYLDAGTTVYQMITFLHQEDIVVVTNGLTHIHALLEKNITTYLIGGFIKKNTSALIGRGALTSIENYRFDKCFLGVNGIHSQFGYTTPDPEEAFIKTAAIQQSREAFVLADSSKFGEVSFSKIDSIKAANIITTETDDEILNPFLSKNFSKGSDIMIYTCTLNPSVDYIVEVENFKVGSLNRSFNEVKYPGGKGINVSRVLHRLGIKSRALGFVGGFTGDYIESYLKSEEIEVDFIKVNADSRINIKLKTGEETEINGQGPSIDPKNLVTLYNQFEQLSQEDVLVLAGSIPKTIPADVYKQIAIKCNEKKIPFVLDTTGQALLDVIPYRPFLIKPNHHELGELFQVEIANLEDAVTYGKKLVELGSQNVIISLGGNGAVFLNNELVLHAEVPAGVVKNSVGAGDSLVAGFVGGFASTNDFQTAFLQGVSAGTATAFSSDLCTNDEVAKISEKVKINRL